MDKFTDADRAELESWLDALARDTRPQPVAQPKPRWRSLGDMARNDPAAYAEWMDEMTEWQQGEE